MNRIQLFKDTVSYQKPERLLLDFGGCPLSTIGGISKQNLMDFFGYKDQIDEEAQIAGGDRIDERILKELDIDTRSFGTILTPKNDVARRISDTEFVDEWGIVYRNAGSHWAICHNPLRDATCADLDAYKWPDPDNINPEQIAAITSIAKRLYEQNEYAICAEHPVLGVFELGCWMCGFDDFLLKMALDPDFVHKFFEIILNYQKKVIDIYYGAVGPYAHYTSSGDDFATQASQFMSLDYFREFVMPYFKERISYTKKYTNAKYLHHSCGSVYPLIPTLIECGVDILNPIQPGAHQMDAQSLKDAYGGKIVLHGGIDTQRILPFGSPQEIDEHVCEVVTALGRDGGYIIAAAHNIQEDVKPENIIAFLQAARKYSYNV